MRARLLAVAVVALGAAGCASPPAEPLHPAWADVAPLFRGACDGCHGWTSPQTGGGYRFDFYDTAACGDAALALNPALPLAGAPGVGALIVEDVLPERGSPWPRMPPQPSPALPDWERDTIERWAVQPAKGMAPLGNRPPTISVDAYPVTVDAQLSFIAVLDDPDGDSVIGVVEANGSAFLMDRAGSFDVSFDTSTWPAGTQTVTEVLCDGWTQTNVSWQVTVKH
ncbi:MAG TPA: hypothetical protein VHO06_17980 [Polyangia bacterium]|nr:hypothetical protein [Polyangia bacterium]